MTTLTILRGLPGSGKTTRARELVADDPRCARVNRDDLRMMMFGAKVNLTVWRAGKTLKLPMVLGERNADKVAQAGQGKPETQGEDVLGLSVRPVTAEEAKALELERPVGLLVTEVSDGSAAAQSGLAAGDVILEANGAAVNTVQAFRAVVEGDGKAKGVVMLLLRRQGQTMFRTIPLPQDK